MADEIELQFDEIIETLKRSSLPTLIVEGKTDQEVYRSFVNSTSISFFPVGGRKMLLKIFASKITFPIRTVFLADRDTWVYTAIPPTYQHHTLIFTSGYSLENEIWVDADPISRIDAEALILFCEELKRFLTWYCLEVSRHINGLECNFKRSPHYVLKEDAFASLTKLRDGEIYPKELFERVHSDYENLLRGKSLIELFARVIPHPGKNQKRDTVFWWMRLVCGKGFGPRLQSLRESVLRAFDETSSSNQVV